MNNSYYIFLDTSFFKALIDPKDQFHKEADNIIQKLRGEEVILVTSNYILDESFTLIRVKCGLEFSERLRQDIALSSIAIKIIRVTVADEANAWDWFKNDWSKLSFTDCVSFAMMKRLEIKRVAAFDAHFQRAGFEIETAITEQR